MQTGDCVYAGACPGIAFATLDTIGPLAREAEMRDGEKGSHLQYDSLLRPTQLVPEVSETLSLADNRCEH